MPRCESFVEDESDFDEPDESDEDHDNGVWDYKPRKRFRQRRDAFTPPAISGIYVLEYRSEETKKFYVGKSNDVARRVDAHMSGQGGVGYLNGRNLRQVALISGGSLGDLESWERNETLERMYRFGIDNVRGWMFTDPELSDDEYEAAFNQICEKFDLCRRCGRNSHFRNNCFARTTAEWSGKMDL